MILSAGCGGGGGGAPSPNLSAQNVSTTIGDLRVGSVAEIPFGGGSSEVLFQQLTGREQFILAFSSFNTQPGTFPFQLAGSESLNSGQNADSDALLSSHKELAGPQDPTSSFHEFLRGIESSLPPPEEGAVSKSMVGTVAKEVSVGDRVSLKVLNSLNSSESYTPISADVVIMTPHFIVYRDIRAVENLSDGDIRSLIDSFEAKVEEEYSVFGTVSDIDQNGKVGIVFSPVLNGMGGPAGVVTGFFFSGDLYPDQFPASNAGEYIYCHVPDDSGQWGAPVPKDFYFSNTGPLCFPHELQHAINFNMKVFVQKSSPEPAPFNEGLSHLAEDLYSDLQKVSAENPSRIQLYFSTGLTSFTGGINLAQRGGAYLFFRYLYEQAGNGRFAGISNGAQFLHALYELPENGFEAVQKAAGEDSQKILGDFFSALYLSNTGLSQDSRYNFKGVNLRATQNDNRGTVLSGPPVSETSLPASLSVSAVSSDYALISGNTLLQAGSTLKLSSDPALVPGAMLIRIEDQ
jgi:hypothetical protein